MADLHAIIEPSAPAAGVAASGPVLAADTSPGAAGAAADRQAVSQPADFAIEYEAEP